MFPRGGLHDHLLALANPTRLRIVEQLAEGEHSVNDLAAQLHVAQPLISWHLRMLRLGGVIRTRREGRQVYCSLDLDRIRVRQEDLHRLLGLEPKPSAQMIEKLEEVK
jgi:DNA-binding transcriptional ArsR family regulator